MRDWWITPEPGAPHVGYAMGIPQGELLLGHERNSPTLRRGRGDARNLCVLVGIALP